MYNRRRVFTCALLVTFFINVTLFQPDSASGVIVLDLNAPQQYPLYGPDTNVGGSISDPSRPSRTKPALRAVRAYIDDEPIGAPDGVVDLVLEPELPFEKSIPAAVTIGFKDVPLAASVWHTLNAEALGGSATFIGLADDTSTKYVLSAKHIVREVPITGVWGFPPTPIEEWRVVQQLGDRIDRDYSVVDTFVHPGDGKRTPEPLLPAGLF